MPPSVVIHLSRFHFRLYWVTIFSIILETIHGRSSSIQIVLWAVILTKRQVLRMFYFLNTFSLSAVIKHILTHDWWMTCLALLTDEPFGILLSCSLIFIFYFWEDICLWWDGWFYIFKFSWLLFWLVGSECCVVGQVMLVMSSHLVLWHSCDALHDKCSTSASNYLFHLPTYLAALHLSCYMQWS